MPVTYDAEDRVDLEEQKDDESLTEHQKQERELKRKCARVRRECLSKVRAAMDSTILGAADFRAYRDKVLSDDAYAISGVTDMAEKLRQLEQMRDTWIPQVIEQSPQLEAKVRRMLDRAKSAGGIGDASYEKWIARLNDDNIIYYQKKVYVENELPGYVENWVRLGEDLKKVEEKRKKLGLGEREIPELSTIKVSGFLDAHYSHKRNAVDKAFAALAAIERGQYSEFASDAKKALYVQAEAMLQEAVSMGALASWKVGTWLRRIFESGAKPDLIKKFLSGEGNMPLKNLIKQWAEVRGKFNDLEKKFQTAKPPPMSFHFVSKEIFLDWHFERRKAYVEEAARRFTDIRHERYDFLQIRNMLDMKDWDEAEELINRAKRGMESMSSQDREKLKSMEKYLREHRPAGQKKESMHELSDGDVVNKARGLMCQCCEASRDLNTELLRRGAGAFRCGRICRYNRKWVRTHIPKWDDQHEENLWQDAQRDTKDRITKGHRRPGDKWISACDVTDPTNVKEAIGDQYQVNKPQVLFNNRKSTLALAENMDRQQNNRFFWYWSTLITRDIRYEQQLHEIESVDPQLQKLSYEMDKRGIYFTESGGISYKNQIAHASSAKNAGVEHGTKV